ncbi:PREDICTED: uncharacterized protein LOC106806104 [Priapulus caudatus]|uniref:Uncharacterized protein LOC106806104 n=1 Tax=Priapulus caudatus TaxID=37621 RepID=A0ABM1DU23_PRICU|nr:PREDICTED: uncharacterized protein LOC106806104 [Priapulus caudatus]
MTYATSKEALEAAYTELTNSDVAEMYPKYIQHCEHLYDRRAEWALCYREELPVRGNNTKNYAEAAMRILKDKVFERVKAYNAVQLLDFLLTRMTSYYERRLTDLANGCIDVTVSQKYLPGGAVIPKEMVTKTGPDTFECRSQSKEDVTYYIEMSISLCTCCAGINGAPCKHQYAVVRHFNVSSLNFLPLNDPVMRQHLLYLATGMENVRPGWFTSLTGGVNHKPVELEEDNAVDSCDNVFL